jgi:hypothetical protein
MFTLLYPPYFFSAVGITFEERQATVVSTVLISIVKGEHKDESENRDNKKGQWGF